MYTQQLKNKLGCDSILNLDLTINSAIAATLNAGPDTIICEDAILKLNGSFTGNGSVHWSSSNGTLSNENMLGASYFPSSVGLHQLILNALDDCRDWVDSMLVEVLPLQNISVTGDTVIGPCNDITFIVTGGTNYIWTPSQYIECLDPACSHIRLKSNQNLRFTITTDGPCVIPASLNLSLSQSIGDVFIPNAFTPNGDNINDEFKPIFFCDDVEYYNLQIFDRWGNRLFESFNKDKGWFGKANDEPLNPGVFVYMIQYQLHGQGKKIRSGDVTLIK